MRPLVLLFFFLSGLSGLLYEVVWIRAAGGVIGNTTHAIGTVLGVYMGGLALGAAWGGRLAGRRSGPSLVRLYGLLECGIGLTAALVPVLIGGSEPVFRWLWTSLGTHPGIYGFLRVILVALLLIVPTTLMGATLPVLARFFTQAPGSAPSEAGRAYAINTLGGFAGTVAAGFWLIPAHGLSATIGVAVAFNVLIAAGALLLGKGASGQAPSAPSAPVPAAPTALVVAAVSGSAAMIYEVAWTRALVLAMGSTVYSFTIILSAFILGLALGSAAAARLLGRIASGPGPLGAVQLAIGVLALLLLPLLGNLPLLFAELVEGYRKSYGTLLAWQSGIGFVFVFLPALFMGAVFPLACRLASAADSSDVRPVSAVYVWNTAGCILGSLLASFLLVPLLGLSGTIKGAAAANLLAAAWLFRTKPGLGAFPLGVLLAGLFLPAWNPKVLSAGSFLYGEQISKRARSARLDLRTYVDQQSVVEAEEWDAYGLVTVHRSREGARSMRINGKVDASSGAADMLTQRYLAHLPLLHHPDPRKVLVIGLGAGVTLGAVARYPVQKIDCVEISPAVARAARHFKEANEGSLDDPRVTLIIGDGRTTLLFGRERYDAVICQPSNLWLSGMANLFTRDFFRQASQRLAPGGVFCQWIHAYRLSREDFESIVRTYYSVFPHGSVWEIFPGTDYVLLGSQEGSPRPWAALDAAVAAARCPELLDPAHPGALALAGHLLGTAESARTAAGAGTLLTDDHNAIEYSAPWSLYQDDRPAILDWLDRVREAAAERVVYGIEAGPAAAAVAARRASRREVARGMRAYSAPRPRTSEPLRYDPRGPDALRIMEAARVKFGEDKEVREFYESIAAQVLAEGKASLQAGFREDAMRAFESIPEGSAAHAEARRLLTP